MSIDFIKDALGKTAANLIKDNQLVGLGTGSTAKHFIKHLITRCQNGLNIEVIASSKASEQLAREGNLKFADETKVTKIDITVDGADEVDRNKNMIKGRGGALLREKILISSSERVVILVDENKIVNTLGNIVLPIEIIPFAYSATLHKLEKLNLACKLREVDGRIFVTDEGNYIVDVRFKSKNLDLRLQDTAIKDIPGVVETGFFFDLAETILVGLKDGQIVEL